MKKLETKYKETNMPVHPDDTRLARIIEISTEAIISINEMQKIVFFNKGAEKIFGYSSNEILEQPLNLLIPGKVRHAHSRHVTEFVDSPKVALLIDERKKIHGRRKNGDVFPAEASISKFESNGEKIYTVILRDITERKKTTEALESLNLELRASKQQLLAANQQLETNLKQLEAHEEVLEDMATRAEAANISKSEFLANMSHEIRTPLNAIIGMTELTLETELNSEQREYLNVVQSSSEGLLSLINDILDYSKIEAGQMEIEEIGFNLRQVVEGTAEMFSLRAESKGLELLCYVAPNVPSWVISDPTRLRQILVNLVANAVKFTEQGEVVIKVEAPNLQKDLNNKEKKIELHFKVVDTGVGISQKNIEKIFDKFCQSDSSITRKFGGTGLGLSISKTLIKLMGGELSVESEEGLGSTFQFKLTLPVGESRCDEVEDFYPALKHIVVLVVDDNATNRFILRKTLTPWGFKVKEAQSGPQALAFLKNCNPTIDLIILDQEMPDMDGFELARRIRKIPELKDLKMIMLSSLGSLNSKSKQKLGISESITKPVRQSKLFDSIMRVLWHDKHKDAIVQVVKSEEVSTQKIRQRILLVEDNLDNQKLAKAILEKAGYFVEMAENGQLALEAVRKFGYDLILMDVYMPVMDGLEATKNIRAWERSQKAIRTPIIALTAHALAGYRDKCLSHDMDGYITKPLRKKILLESIEQLLEERQILIPIVRPHFVA